MRDDYNGDLQAEITSFLKLHEKFAWKKQLREDIESIRSEVRLKGAVKAETINETIKKYRKNVDGVSGKNSACRDWYQSYYVGGPECERSVS